MAVVLNGEPVYPLIIFPKGSSHYCETSPFIHLHEMNDQKGFKISFVLNDKANDPRFDINIKQYADIRFKK